MDNDVKVGSPLPAEPAMPKPTESANSQDVLAELDRLYAHPDSHPPAERREWDVIAPSMRDRQAVGVKTYGTVLKTHNGRSALRDLTEELLDAVFYAGQLHLEEPAAWTLALLDRLVAEASRAVHRLQPEPQPPKENTAC